MTQIPFLGNFKTILLLTDEDVAIYRPLGKGVELAGTVPWENPQLVDDVLDIIHRKCGAKPLIVLNDMSEQFYKVDSIPLIRNPMDRTSMVKRKVTAAFPQYKITGTLLQSDKLRGKKESNHRAVMAAIPSSQKIQRINNILNFSGLQVLNVGLLPVESASLVDTLSLSLNRKRDRSRNHWSIFVAQNSNGGLRQIVTKNAQIALTRMTPIVNTDSDPEIWAGEVSQELQATMTYLSRFDYRSEDNLEVIVIANPAAGQALEALMEVSCSFFSLTVSQAASRLGIAIPRPEEGRFIDPVHARWAANKAGYIMDIKAQEIEKIANARLGSIAACILLFLSFLYLASGSYASFSHINKINQDITKARAEKIRVTQLHQEAVENSEVTEYNVNLVQGAVSVFEQSHGHGIVPADYLARIKRAADIHNVTFATINMEFKDLQTSLEKRFDPRRPYNPAVDQNQPKGQMIIRVELIFPGDIAPEIGNAQVERLALSIEEEFEELNFQVGVTKFLRDLTFESQFSGRAGLGPQKQNSSPSFNAEIQISGEVS